MEPIDVRALESAVLVFYSSGASQHAAAHDWLTKAQTSPQAWSFVWELMKLDKVNTRTHITFNIIGFMIHFRPSSRAVLGNSVFRCNNAALQTREILVGSAQGELRGTEAETDELHHFVWQWTANRSESVMHFGMIRVCCALRSGQIFTISFPPPGAQLSAFIVQMFQDWPTAVEDVSHSLQTHQLPNVEPKMQIWIMMEILCAIPDEALAITTSVQRTNMRNDLALKAPYVLNVLEHYLESKCGEGTALDTHDLETLQVAAKCASAWLRNYAFPLDTCTPLATSMVKLVNKCYWNCMTTDGCLSAEENELTEWCLETLTVSRELVTNMLASVLIQFQSLHSPCSSNRTPIATAQTPWP